MTRALSMRKYRQRRKKYGRLTVPVAEVIEHIERVGYSRPVFAQLTGLSEQTIDSMYAAGRVRVSIDTANPIFAITTPTPGGLPDRSLIPAAGTRRRLESLQLDGWPLDVLAEHLGRSRGSLSQTMNRDKVTAQSAREVAALFRKLDGKRGPSPIAARWARRNGYLPAAAFDVLDDPHEQPKGVAV